ncbi:PAS domain S-box protein [Hymenobacter busanensis]|uniref:histidine kinase n=1 Tax=Hymenobacter busanensis TaxID=2607656 RepID=A0A7L4ZV27_9BACT|nr:PAS domain S-box protein [Hymenobacter busanensis]KAA9327609.1 PAS domain S-box protein [Hymenobacter busanensis]QHJ06052.1 PAS domain S-box protein [Hymenobacter busanensis]
MASSIALDSTATEAAAYRALFDHAYDALFIYDERGHLIDCNHTAVQLLGTTRPLLLAAGLMAYVRPDAEARKQPAWLTESDELEAVLQTARTGEQQACWWYGQRPDLTPIDGWLTLHRLEVAGTYRVQLTLRNVTQPQEPYKEAVQLQVQTQAHPSHQLRDVLSRANLCYLLLDAEAKVVDFNDYFAHLTGYTREELLGRDYFDVFAPPMEREPRRFAFNKAWQEHQLQDFFERALLTRDGKQHTLYWYSEFDRDASGAPTGVLFVGRDLSEGQVVQRVMTDNRTRLQDFLDNAHDLIQNLSIDNHFLFVNKAWKEKLGYDDDDLPNLTLSDVVHPYYKAKLMYQLRNLYKGEKVNKLETVFLTKTGKPVHLIGSINCSWDDGEPVSTRAILHDITDRIKAERLQKVYYSIANLAISSKDLHSLYGAIHRELSKIIETNNFYIALTDENRTQLQFVYFIDQNTQFEKAATSRPFSSGVSEYIIRTGKPQFLLKPDLQALIADGTITAYGLMPEVMLCSPLSVGDRIIGVITVQDYTRPDVYAPGDLEILHFISNQVALAIERKRNEVQINKQNARLNAIFESGTHLMWSVDMKSRLTSFNRNYAAYFLRRNGVHPALNVNLWQADLAMMEEDARQLFVENYSKAFEGVPQRFEVRLRDVRGQDTWREIYLNPIYLDDGTFEEISGIAHDITDKKRGQLELAAQEEKFRAIFESFQDVYYRTDGKGVLTLVSPSVEDMLGYTPEEVTGTPIADYYLNPDERESLLTAVRDHGEARNFEVAMRHKDGHAVSVLVNARMVQDGPAGTEGIGRDITELKKMQDDLRRAKDEAEAALHAKTQFLANMSHELRTPMNGIIGMIDLLHQTVASEEQEEYVDTLRKSSDALLAILNDILDLSKIQAGKMELSVEGMDLHYTLEKIHSLFANRATQKNLRFTYRVAENVPRFIVMDETRLLQVLSNLTSNAIKFTAQGTVSIVVSGAPEPDGTWQLRFAVQDSGIGISEENEKLLFTNFTQLDTTPTKSFGGTGLGLAISKQLTELMGGTIGLYSNTGEGSTFWFTIRCQVAYNKEEILRERQQSRDRAPEILRFEDAPKVLLVDDNPINQKVAIRLLDKLGCDTELASDGFEAIGKATSGKRYDLIFMDIQMPEMDGITAMREIRRRLGPACPPVVAMTAYSMKEDAERFVQEGMDDYVSKPVKSQDLFAVLRRWRPLPHVAEPAVVADAPAVAAQPALPAVPEPEAEVDTRPIIDAETMEQLRQLGGADFAAGLYADFEVEAEPLLAEAGNLVEQGKFAEILPHLHQLKGTGFTLGLIRLAEQAKHLEHDLKQTRTEHTKRDFQALLRYFAEFKAEYPVRTNATN